MTENVISSKVIGSANPIAKKFRDIKSAFAGIGVGIVLLIVGMFLIYQSVYGVKEYSKIVNNLPLTVATETNVTNADLIKLKGYPTASNAVKYGYEKCTVSACTPGFITTATLPSAYYIKVEKQRFEVVEHRRTETRTKNVGGDEVEEEVEIIEYKEEWVTKETAKQWATFNLGNIKVTPSDSINLIADLVTAEVANVKINNLTPLNNYNQTPSASVGNTKIVYSYLPLTDAIPEFIVVGSLANGSITSGDPFILTTKTNAQMVQTLETEENVTKLGYAIFSWLAVFIGLSMLLAPIIELVEWIPLFGGAAKFAAGAISFIVATVLVLGGYLVLKFWWVIIIILVALVAGAIVLIRKKGAPKTAPAVQTAV